MLAGEMPFRSNSVQGWITCHLYDQPKPMSEDIPNSITELIMQCLEKDREQRPKSAIELKDRLIEIERQIQRQEKEQENQFIENIKLELKNNLILLEDYRKMLKSKAVEIQELTAKNKELKEEVTRLNNLLDRESDNFDEEKIKYAASAIGYELIGNLNDKAVIVPSEIVDSSKSPSWDSSKSPSWFDDLKDALERIY